MKNVTRELFEFVQSIATLEMGKIDAGNRHELNDLESAIREAWRWSERLQLREVTVSETSDGTPK